MEFRGVEISPGLTLTPRELCGLGYSVVNEFKPV